jgi:hypothetical protein
LPAGMAVYDQAGANVTARAGSLSRGVYFVQHARTGTEAVSKIVVWR